MTYQIALGVEYDGTQFSGSQSQAGRRTVQSVLETALSRVADEEVRIGFAGRTDSGVHATHQVGCFRTNAKRADSAWIRGANTYLPEDVVVHSCHEVDMDFDPRRSSKWRRYLYVYGEQDVLPAIGRNLATWVNDSLDVVRMHEQSQCLLGEHDFSSFRAAQCQSISPRRCIHAISITRWDELVVLDVVANAYLLRMVRNIAGALLAISRGQVSDLAELLKNRDRRLAPPTARSDGLYLCQIAYEDYPFLSAFRIPPLLSSKAELPVLSPTDFIDVRPEI